MESNSTANNDPGILKMQEIMDFADRSECTKKGYLTYTIPFINYCHNTLHKDMAAVTYAEIRGYLNSIQAERGLSNRTVNHAISELKFLFTCSGLEWDDLQVPHKNFSSPVLYVPEKSRIRDLINSIDDLKKKAMVIVLYGTGMRVSELCHLKCTDIKRDDHYIHIDDGKGGKGRKVPLSDTTLKALEKYWWDLPQTKKTRDWLFTQERNIANPADPELLQKFLKRHIASLGWTDPITPHTFRRAFATHLYVDGYSIEMISRLLGHASIQSTLIYVYLGEAMLAQSVKSPIEGLDIIL